MASFESPTFESPTKYQSPSASKEMIVDNQEDKEYPKHFPVTELPKSITKPGGNPTYILESGNFLYRGSAEKDLQLHRLTGIQWYALDLFKVFQYGYPSKYRLNRNLTLLAIDEIDETHPFFTGLDQDMKRKFNKFFTYDKNGNKQRVSIPKNDYDLCEYICSLGYDGYAMNEMDDDSNDASVKKKNKFHAEVALNNGHEKLILIEHINVDKITDENGEKLRTDPEYDSDGEKINDGEEINTTWILSKIVRNKQRAEGLKNRKPKRDYDHNFASFDNSSSMFNAEYTSPPKQQRKSLFGYDSPEPTRRSSLFGLPTGGKTKKKNRKTKKNKKKQTKKKNKKSKRKSNKK